MREITSLQTLCLRAVGASTCSAEETFAPTTTNNDDQQQQQPSLASRLLRSFHKRPHIFPHEHLEVHYNKPDSPSIECIPMKRKPTIGVRRAHASDVDLHHPLIACQATKDHHRLINQFSNPALDLLQSFIDSLIEMGRMGDSKLGRHFFQEFIVNVQLAHHSSKEQQQQEKRLKIQPLGGLSLYQATISDDTFEAMMETKVGPYLAVLDLTGVHGLSDKYLEQLLPTCTNLQRLSLKNCRRITDKTLQLIGKHQKELDTLDLGGSFNLTTEGVLALVPKLPNLFQLHVSGLNWTNHSLGELTQLRKWKALSLGFSVRFTAAEFRNNLLPVADSLEALAIPFCENIVDNALMGALGRNLPNVKYLDVRGNSGLATLTGWYDGRASADLGSQPLTVLARYSGLSEASVDETKRTHPMETQNLRVILDGKGMGIGIQRVFQS